MSKLTNAEFIEFIESFNDKSFNNHRYYDTITEISRKKSGKQDALIENDFLMYSLDDIAKGSRELSSNLPKTADALYYKEDDDGNLSLYFIEFKFHNLDDPDAKDFLYTFVDEIYASEKDYKCVSKYKHDFGVNPFNLIESFCFIAFLFLSILIFDISLLFIFMNSTSSITFSSSPSVGLSDSFFDILLFSFVFK